MRIDLPDEVKEIIKVLMNNKYEGYAVGGCIRDLILNRKPNDWDITTNAKPQELMEIFNSYYIIPTGLKHGTVTLMINNNPYEITTYRIEGKYSDNRRPDEVEFTNDITKDLSRRDFTINAMAYNDFNGLIDPFKGLEDLSAKKIKCVGDPERRFNEDALRMLRGIRFSSQLEFQIDFKTKRSIITNSYLLENISKERINVELNKILLSNTPSKGIRNLVETNLIKHIIPDIIDTIGFQQHNTHHSMDVFEHTLCVVDRVDNDIILRLAALFHDIAKPQCFKLDDNGIGHFYKHDIRGMEITRDRLKQLKYSNSIIDSVKKLVKEHMCRFDNITEKGAKKLIKRVGDEDVFKLFNLQLADTNCKRPSVDISGIMRVQEMVIKILTNKEPITTNDLDINGYDLMQLGIPQGKQIGLVLDKLLEIVLESPQLNRKESLIKCVLDIKDLEL